MSSNEDYMMDSDRDDSGKEDKNTNTEIAKEKNPGKKTAKTKETKLKAEQDDEENQTRRPKKAESEHEVPEIPEFMQQNAKDKQNELQVTDPQEVEYPEFLQHMIECMELLDPLDVPMYLIRRFLEAHANQLRNNGEEYEPNHNCGQKIRGTWSSEDHYLLQPLRQLSGCRKKGKKPLRPEEEKEATKKKKAAKTGQELPGPGCQYPGNDGQGHDDASGSGSAAPAVV